MKSWTIPFISALRPRLCRIDGKTQIRGLCGVSSVWCVTAVAAFFLTYTQTTKTSKATTSDDFVGTYLVSRSQ